MAIQPSCVSPCPKAAVLAGYVRGMLDESAAERVLAHLDQCAQCQEYVDDLTPQRDTLLSPLRQTGMTPLRGDPSELVKLLELAERVRPLAQDPTPIDAKRAPLRPVALDTFLASLRQSGLIEPDELDALLAISQPVDSVELARDLVARKRLTPFQSRLLLRGRWKGLVLGNYVVLDKLGQGGMGAVFKARHRRMGRVVCLKVPHSACRRSPALLDRFRQEARTAAALAHPNIVVAHDADEAEGIPFLVMEFVEGRDLAGLVARQGPLSPKQAIGLVLQVAQALAYAHRRGVIHRDIKPHNLLLDESGTVKILDLGLARFDSFLAPNPDATTHASVTASGVIMGSVDYMAPEQALNGRLADQRSDIYSLGCTFYFLLMGKVLYAGETLMEKLVAHREQVIPSLATVAPESDAVFQRMVAKSPAERYPSMTELVADLEAVKAGRAIPVRQSPQRRKTRRWITVLVPAAMVLLAGGLLMARSAWVQSGQDEQASPSQRTVSSPPPSENLPLIGHPDTRVNGGPGRVLIVLPHDWFYEDHYTGLEQALNAQGIRFLTASSQPGLANPKHGGIPPVPVKLTLDQFDVADFDAVVFVGGNINEFTHKNIKASQEVRSIIAECLTQGRSVAAIDNGVGILDDAGITQPCAFQQFDGYALCRPEGKAGALLTSRDATRATDLVRAILDPIPSN